MADTTTVAAKKKTEWQLVEEMPFEVDPFSKYMYILSKRNSPREAPVHILEGGRERPYRGEEFKQFQNLLMRSSIVWDGKSPKPPGWGDKFAPGRRMIRYYDGCESIYMDEQPKEKEIIEPLVQGTIGREFHKGELSVMGYDKMLKLYCDICSYNEESPYRVPSVRVIFKPVNPEFTAAQKNKHLDAKEEALKLAKDTKFNKMRMHANYLGIPETDPQTNQALSEEALRAYYREAADRDPVEFVRSYNDKKTEVKYFIEKAIETGIIGFNLNTAIWKQSGAPICDMSGFASPEGKVQRLTEYASLGEGEEFATQIKALYKD